MSLVLSQVLTVESPPPATGGPPYAAQVSLYFFTLDIFYLMATVSLIFIVAAIGLVDAGLVRRKNILDQWVQKIVGGMIAGLGIFAVGYALWIWQYYSAFGAPDPLKSALKDWTPFGPAMEEFSTNLDPARYVEADVFQIFVAFFVAYIAVGAALLHSAGLERVKAAPYYVLCAFFGALVSPYILYLTWGSAGPLTVKGAHDYVGIFALYLVVGVWALILMWRVGPRIGAFDRDPRTIGPVPHNLSWTALGIGLLMFSAPFAFLGCGFFIPDLGYYGISLSDSGFGIAVMNIFAAYIGGVIGGAIIAYKTRKPIFALLGVPGGYISNGTSLDVGKPWEIAAIAFAGMFVLYGVFMLLYKLRLDDKKVVPLTLGCGTVGAFSGAIVASGEKTGGFFGITEGKYAFQSQEISFGMQAAAYGVTIAIAAVSGLILILALEKTIGLRVRDEDEITGLDATYWDAQPPPYDDLTGREIDERSTATATTHRGGRHQGTGAERESETVV